jgi:hypothetical protein
MNEDTSSFDPTAFLDATTTEALVRRPPLPVGDYLGITQEITSETWSSNKPDAKVKSGVKFNVPVKIDLSAYPDQKAAVGGIESITLTAGVMIDSTVVNGRTTIDWGVGKNGGLRRWREATGCNNPGETFSPRQMSGRQVLVKIKHRVYQGEAYDEIDSVAKA